MRSVVPPEWEDYSESIKHAHACNLRYFLIQLGRSPATVREDDFALYISGHTGAGGSYESACRTTSCMRKILLIARANEDPPRIRTTKLAYGIALSDFPEPLRSQVTEICNFRLHSDVGTSGNRPVRSTTAKACEYGFSFLYGYAVNIAGNTGATTIEKLVEEKLCRGYANWILNERHLLGSSLLHTLKLVSGALRANPRYASIGDNWLPELITSIPRDSEGMMWRRKDRRFLPYEALARIPEILRRSRPRGSNSTPRKIALAIRDELLMQWLAILPWRQKNICELRISGALPNLYRDVIPQMTSLMPPIWAADAPDSPFWQVQFSSVETNIISGVRFVLPRCLVGSLNEYLTHARPVLVRRPDPGTLFLDRSGRPLKNPGFRFLVETLTLRTCGRVVTPKAYRDIFARMYLERCPNDYLTLSKLLWHKSILSTLRLYGRPFDQSAAMCRMEHVLDGRGSDVAVPTLIDKVLCNPIEAAEARNPSRLPQFRRVP